MKYFILAALGVATGYLISEIVCGYEEKKEAENRIQILPDAEFISLPGEFVNLHSFDDTKNLAIIYFHPECEHCQYEAREIGQNAGAFGNCQLVMVTSDDSLQRVKNFCETNNLWEVDNIEVLLDTQNQFKKVFGKAVIPSVYIYGADRKLKRQFLGETKIEAIIGEIEKEMQ